MVTTRTLILMRHAAAGHQGATRDHDRPLTAGGTADAADAGEWIRSSLPTVDAVICSTSVRTRQTLAATMIDGQTRFSDQLYGGGVDEILGEIASTDDSVSTLLVIGHAPVIGSTAYELVTLSGQTGSDDPDIASQAQSGDENAAQGGDVVDDLRHFSAGSVAVLTTTGPWSELAENGATLTVVRDPRR